MEAALSYSHYNVKTLIKSGRGEGSDKDCQSSLKGETIMTSPKVHKTLKVEDGFEERRFLRSYFLLQTQIKHFLGIFLLVCNWTTR